MISYRDMTFCDYYKDCSNGYGCFRALTDEVVAQANRWWNGDNPEELANGSINHPAPIAIFNSKPICFVEEDDE